MRAAASSTPRPTPRSREASFFELGEGDMGLVQAGPRANGDIVHQNYWPGNPSEPTL